MKALSIFNQLRPISVGFDSMFDHFERMFDEGEFRTANPYPPYNIVKKSDQLYDIEVAVAGYGKKDVTVNYADNLLTIKSVSMVAAGDLNEAPIWIDTSFGGKLRKETYKERFPDNVLHQGIARRHFTRSFTIADDVEVKGAELKDGLLKVSLERIVPEGKKAKTIEIK